MITEKRSPSYVFEIYIAGDIHDAKRALVKIASQQGACWSVEPVEYIYSGGRELGCVIRYINYPRFTKTAGTLEKDAVYVATELMSELGQNSCSIVGPDETIWLTNRLEK